MTNEAFPEFTLPDELLGRPLDVMVLGNSRLEMVVQVPGWSAVGGQKDQRVERPIYTAGGCGANVACFAARLGGRAALVSRLGDGRDSEPVWNELRRSGVDTRYVKRIEGSEGSLLVILTNPDGDWTVLSYVDATLEVRPEDLPDKEALESAKILHIEGFYLGQDHPDLESVVSKAREAGCLISTDGATPVANSRPERLTQFFGMSDIVFANRSEALAASKTKTPEDAAAAFPSMGPRLSFLKLGQEGSWVVTPERLGRVPAYEVEVIDTVAAGDAYAAASLLHLCQGGTLSAAARRGSAAGALACRGPGSLSSVFDARDVDALLGAS